jgi:very-long-chain (3R)-3-hydroxyacyl-CoA dehydratase
MIRYLYYTISIGTEVPKLITWLRYSGFIVLYPLGFLSETLLAYNLLRFRENYDGIYIITVLIVIFCFSYGYKNIYIYMLKQRKKYLN